MGSSEAIASWVKTKRQSSSSSTSLTESASSASIAKENKKGLKRAIRKEKKSIDGVVASAIKYYAAGAEGQQLVDGEASGGGGDNANYSKGKKSIIPDGKSVKSTAAVASGGGGKK